MTKRDFVLAFNINSSKEKKKKKKKKKKKHLLNASKTRHKTTT